MANSVTASVFGRLEFVIHLNSSAVMDSTRVACVTSKAHEALILSFSIIKGPKTKLLVLDFVLCSRKGGNSTEISAGGKKTDAENSGFTVSANPFAAFVQLRTNIDNEAASHTL